MLDATVTLEFLRIQDVEKIFENLVKLALLLTVYIQMKCFRIW